MSDFDRGGVAPPTGPGGALIRRFDRAAAVEIEFAVGEDTGPFEVSGKPEVVHGKE